MLPEEAERKWTRLTDARWAVALGSMGLAAYQRAKWAVSGFLTGVAQEVAPFGVKVTVLELGGVKTDCVWDILERCGGIAALVGLAESRAALNR